jgi:branched-chain amino acid transport system permease protein
MSLPSPIAGAQRVKTSLLAAVADLREGILLALIVAVVALATSAWATLSLQQTVIYALVLLVIVLALFLFSGLSGVLSFGHIGFVAIGAYTAGLLTLSPTLKHSLFSEMPGFLSWVLDAHFAFIPALFAGGFVAAVVGALLSIPIARLNGISASIATLAFLEVVNTILLQWDQVTRGASAVIGVPPNTTLFTAAACAAVVLIVVAAVQHSRLGLRLRAARADEAAAQACGIDIVSDRRLAFIGSAFLAGVGGALYAQFTTTFSPTSFGLELTFTTVAMLIVGGLTSLRGAFIGVALVSTVSEILQRIQDHGLGPIHTLPAGTTQMVVALILVGVLILSPAGLAAAKHLNLSGLSSLGLRFRTSGPAQGARDEPT